MAKSVDVKVTFEQPDNRRRDQDNMIAAIKPLLDAVSAYVGVDDSKFRLTFEFPEERQKPGAVIVEVMEDAD